MIREMQKKRDPEPGITIRSAAFLRILRGSSAFRSSSVSAASRTASASTFLRSIKRPGKILDQIVRIFQADGKAYRAFGNARCAQRRLVHAVMRGSGRMDHQRLGIADVGKVRKHLER